MDGQAALLTTTPMAYMLPSAWTRTPTKGRGWAPQEVTATRGAGAALGRPCADLAHESSVTRKGGEWAASLQMGSTWKRPWGQETGHQGLEEEHGHRSLRPSSALVVLKAKCQVRGVPEKAPGRWWLGQLEAVVQRFWCGQVWAGSSVHLVPSNPPGTLEVGTMITVFRR